MPTRPPTPCKQPGCANTVADGHGRCPGCRARRPARSGSADGYDWYWHSVIRPGYLTRHPRCCLCGRRSETPDHHPHSRKQLLAAGVTNPDADCYLRPLCRRCHSRQTAIHQPGGWWADAQQ